MCQKVDKVINSLSEMDNLSNEISPSFFGLNEKCLELVSHLYIFNKEHRCIFANLSGALLVGLKPSEMIGKHWSELGFSTNIMETFDTVLSRVLATGNYETTETIGHYYSGGFQFYRYSLFPIQESDGDISAVLCMVKDITELKKNQKRFWQEVQILEKVITFNTTPMLVIDREEKVSIINQSFVDFHPQIRGEPFTTFIGRPYKELTDSYGKVYEETVIIKALRSNKVVKKKHVNDFGKYWIVNATPIFDEATGEVEGAVAIYDDITEHEQWRESMARFDRLSLIGEMAAGVAHEVRNPMTVVKGYLQYLGNKVDIEMKEQFELVLRELGTVENLVTNFLSLAKNKRVEFQVQSLNDIVKDIYPLLYTDTVSKGIDICLSLAEEVPLLRLNEKEIKQLILNLARNAIEAINIPHGVLRIETTFLQEGWVYLCVSDNGSGIDKSLQDKIFDPFFTTKDRGTGLGLSVCASIVERHNASILCDSEQGQGTTVTVKFPIYSFFSEDSAHSDR